MANSNWNGGHAKGHAQAKAWLRHNEKDRRADPQVDHSNRDIDRSRTSRNFEVGPTKGWSYDRKCDRLEARLDEFGYPTDNDLGPIRKTTPSSMQGIVIYAPDDLDNDEAEADGRLEAWAEDAVAEAASQFGEENIIAAYVDVDEVHDYTDAQTGEVRRSKRHIHLYVVPVCEVKAVEREPVYLTPEGEETTEESEAEQVYVTDQNAETDDPERAAIDEETGEPKMRAKRARTKSGRPKYKKKKRSEVTKKSTKLSGSEFCLRDNIMRFNKAVDDMTREKYGIKWNTGVARDPDKRNQTTEELKAKTAEREIAQRVEEAAAEIEAKVKASEQTLDDAEAAAKTIKTDAENEAKTIKDDAEAAAKTLKTEAENIKTDAEHRQAVANEELARAYHGYLPATDGDGNETRLTIYSSPDDDAALGRWLKSLPGQLPEGREVYVDGRRLTVAGPYVPGAKVIRYEARRDARNALSEERAALAERERKVKAQEAKNTQDAVLNERRRHAYETAKKEYEDAAKRMDDYVAQLREEWTRLRSNVVGWVTNAMHHLGGFFAERARVHTPNDDAYWVNQQASEDMHKAANLVGQYPNDPRLIAACSPDAPPWETVEKPKPVDTASVDAMIAAAMDAGLEDGDDTEPKKPGTAKRQGQRTTRAVTAQRLIASVETGQSLDDIDSTPADDYGFEF